MNRTLLEKVRCMLVGSGVPKTLWGEALMTATYIVNRTPSSALDDKTPEEQWSGSVSDYTHLRVFGCAAYSHQNLGKLEPRAQKCVFLGYPDGVKGYRLWSKDSGGFKIITSRDVTFDELNMPCLKGKESDKVSDRLESDRTKLQVELGIPTQPVDAEEVETEAGNDVSDGDIEETEVQDAEEEQNVEGSDYQLTRDRVRREIREPIRYRDYLTLALISYQDLAYREPKSYEEAMPSKQSKE